jgi:hypothetical protein
MIPATDSDSNRPPIPVKSATPLQEVEIGKEERLKKG